MKKKVSAQVLWSYLWLVISSVVVYGFASQVFGNTEGLLAAFFLFGMRNAVMCGYVEGRARYEAAKEREKP